MFWGKQGCCRWYLSPGQQILQNPLSACEIYQTAWQSNCMSSSPRGPELWLLKGLLFYPLWKCCLLLLLQFRRSSPPLFGSTSAMEEEKKIGANCLLWHLLFLQLKQGLILTVIILIWATCQCPDFLLCYRIKLNRSDKNNNWLFFSAAMGRRLLHI